MKTRVAFGLVCASLAVLLTGCGRFDFFGEPREAWRDAEEKRCLRAGELVPSAFAEPLPPINQKYSCGLEHPFRISALNGGAVAIQPAARLGCPMNSALNRWMREVVQPAAYSNFGQPVVGIKNIASYGCRTRNNKRGAKLSEHSFGNALDIKVFYLADGREVSVLGGWKGAPDERAFLRQVHAGACGTFKTVLGPGSDGYHEDHFHLDLARHNANWTAYCRPHPRSVPSAPQFGPSPGGYGGYSAQPQPGYGPPPQDYPPQPYEPTQDYPSDPYAYPQGPASDNVPMSYAQEPRWPIARVPTPYAGGVSEEASDD